MQNQISRGEEQIAVLFWHGVIREGRLSLWPKRRSRHAWNAVEMNTQVPAWRRC